jgi:hypothetical protein
MVGTENKYCRFVFRTMLCEIWPAKSTYMLTLHIYSDVKIENYVSPSFLYELYLSAIIDTGQ